MKYNPSKIEKKWQKTWLKEGVYEPNFKNPREKGKFYNLMMFPYPSAEGLHVGNMYAFTGSDIYGRFKRMAGHDVLEPIGLDGFGIHSENYAIKVGTHPADQTKKSEKNFYRQLTEIGNGFAWKEKLETYDPEYYKWTQWLFIQMFKNGLVYRKKQPVNWCPSCKTVLADEQVILAHRNLGEVGGGECERCGTKVIKKDLEQWFFKITDYAERLLNNLEDIDWSEKIKVAQRAWIGKSEGALLKFSIAKSQSVIDVFTTRADTLYGATYMVLAPEHPLVNELKSQITNWDEVQAYREKAKGKTDIERTAEGKEKTGVELKGIKAINPANNQEISVWIADYVLAGYGTGAIMAVPQHDERDAEFAKKFDLPFSDAPLVAVDEIVKKVSGKKITQYRLRDWLISRQRYWGPPIPMIHCEKCGWQPVPEKDLPVKLPKIEDFRPTGTDQSPLASVEKFYKTKCPNCKGEARRETDVSDTFLDSAWYYLRYPSANHKEEAFDPDVTKKWLPVDMYIGGAEHAVLHLLYVRFVAMALHDWGFLNFEEPMTRFRAHGLIIKDGAKMSKSKGNVVNPDEYIKKYGADALRMYLMFLGPFEQGGDFRDEGVAGITRFLNRVWALIDKVQKEDVAEIQKTLHQTIKKVTEDIEGLHYNTAISQLMILLREIEDVEVISRSQFEMVLKLLAPFAPHITEEIWRTVLKNKKSIHLEAWPEYNTKHLVEKTANLVLQINGKTREVMVVDRDLSEAQVKELVLASEKMQRHLDGKTIKKFIYLPNRLVNIVTE
ncbi:MAG: class I tRNA ligase family protein [bacterium]|nr:class I tRNA ligase family protein [bacterium]